MIYKRNSNAAELAVDTIVECQLVHHLEGGNPKLYGDRFLLKIVTVNEASIMKIPLRSGFLWDPERKRFQSQVDGERAFIKRAHEHGNGGGFGDYGGLSIVTDGVPPMEFRDDCA